MIKRAGSFLLALVLLVAAAVMVASISLLRPLLKKRHRAMRKAQETVMTTIQEDLQQLELIQSLDVQTPILERFSKRQNISASTTQIG